MLAAGGSSLGPPDEELELAWGAVLSGLAAAERALAAELEAAVGLPAAWIEVLFRLHRTPGQVLPTTQLAHEVSFSSGGFTKVMDRLVAAGLVERRPCPSDRRVVYAALTARGRAVAERSLAVHLDGLRRHVVAAIGRDGLLAIAELMRCLRASQPGAAAPVRPHAAADRDG